MMGASLDQDERMSCLEAALKDCIQQISSFQGELELAEELKAANDRLKKDKLHLEAEIDALIGRVDDVEKENAVLKCECCALERDLLEDSGKQIVPVVEASIQENGNWPWNVLDIILEEHRVSQRSIDELLDEIKGALAPQKKQSELKLSESICRMIELIEEISPASLVSANCLDADLDYYSVHVIRWRNCELVPILQRFVLSCSLVLSGSYGLEDFAMQLTALLEWAVGSCITLDDASRVRGKVKKYFNVDRPKSESELDVDFADSPNVMTKMIKTQCDLQEENKRLKCTLRSLEGENDCLRTRLEELKGDIGRLEDELGDLKEEFENQKLINEDLDTEVSVTKAKQNEMARKISSLEVELEDKNQSYEELETTCLELQLQLEIVAQKGTPDPAEEQAEKTDKKSLQGSEKKTECMKPSEFQECSIITYTNKEKSNQHHSLLDILMLTNDDGTKTEARTITALSSQTTKGGIGFVKKLFVSRRKYSPQMNTRPTLKRPK